MPKRCKIDIWSPVYHLDFGQYFLTTAKFFNQELLAHAKMYWQILSNYSLRKSNGKLAHFISYIRTLFKYS